MRYLFSKYRQNIHHHKDNDEPNSMYKENTEMVYQKYVEDMNKTIKWFEDIDVDHEGYDPEDEYTWLKKPIEEKLKAPDSDFVTNGIHKSMLGILITDNRDDYFNRVHKSSGYGAFRIRVPSLKRNNHEWSKFYNEFPKIAAEVRYGNRRFYNGAKLKYIW